MIITTAAQLANHLQDVRQTQGVSQAKIGEKIGVRQGTVSNFEQNPASTKLETFFKLLAALELEVEIKPRQSTVSSGKAEPNNWGEEW